MVRGMACIKSGSREARIEVDGYLLKASMHERDDVDQQVPNQYGLLLASLAACTLLTLRQFADRQQWPLNSLDVFLTIEQDEIGFRVERTLFATGIDRTCQHMLLDLAKSTPLTLLLGKSMQIYTVLV